jgi:hypothetical protein
MFDEVNHAPAAMRSPVSRSEHQDSFEIALHALKHIQGKPSAADRIEQLTKFADENKEFLKLRPVVQAAVSDAIEKDGVKAAKEAEMLRSAGNHQQRAGSAVEQASDMSKLRPTFSRK